MAIGLSGVIFSLLDPLSITEQMGLSDTSPLAVYTFGFFFFWAVCAWSGFFSILFSRADTPK